MDINGACFCGRVTYQARLDEGHVLICHCRDCQIFAGTAYRMSGIVKPTEFEFTGQEPRIFEKQADSGSIRRMAFCEDCGTHLCSLPTENSGESAFVSVRIGTSEQFHELRPVAEIYTASRVPWLQTLDGCAEFSGMPTRDK